MTDLGIYVGVPVFDESVRDDRCTSCRGTLSLYRPARVLHSLSFVYPYKNPYFAEFPDRHMCSYNALDFGMTVIQSSVLY